ncbi:MAG TPA: LysM peptidoglycan-binding domain-containing protein [Rhabdochlamydiaceae bacterium]|nr:LysM peptidoglycan-binding domain-containing protein [Rhabdochlamydiaceae bacterium]
MSRKDTIIIAILVNAALLVALFVSAIKKDSAQSKMAAQAPSVKEPIFEKPLELPKQDTTAIKAASGDEVDRVLKEFAQNRPTAGSDSSVALTNNENEIKSAAAFPPDPFASFNQPLPQLQSQPQPQLAEERNGNFVEWTVKKGDALEKIARAHRTSVEEIMRLNGLKNSSLRVGQVLKVQASKIVNTVAAPSGNRPAVAVAKEAAVKYYTVKTGDNPWTIAVKNHMKVEELLKLNNLNDEKARRLKPGDELRIR